MFPLFASRFLKRDADVEILGEGPVRPAANHRSLAAPSAPPKASSLRFLDLQTLPRDDGPPTELRTRKEKLAHYEQQCSWVGDRLYVGGETVARNLDILKESAITHIVNCVGFLYPPYFECDFNYQTLYLQDSPGEDILSVLYDVFDFIEGAPDGRVFIHCSQGVSRSCSLAIAYRMWREARSYEEIFAEVKQMRGVANPNIGFICQLIQWHRRRTQEAGLPRLYRIAPQSSSAPTFLIAKLPAAALDPRGAFVLHSQPDVHVWTGAACSEEFGSAALRFAGQLHRYEGAAASPVCVRQGQETEEFWAALEGVHRASARGGSTPPPPPAPGAGPRDVRPVPSYDRDFEIYAKATVRSPDAESPTDSARSGRKTPRAESVLSESPNDRLRKQLRSEEAEQRERSARSTGRSSLYSFDSGSESARAKALDFQELAVRRRVPSPVGLSPLSGGRAATPTLTGAAAAAAAAPAGSPSPAVPRLSLGSLPSPQQQQHPALAGGDDLESDQAPTSTNHPHQPLAGGDDLDLSPSSSSSSDAGSELSSDDEAPAPAAVATVHASSAEAAAALRPLAVPRLNLG